MKKLILLFVVTLFSVFAFAGENEIFFDSKAQCDTAKAVKYYTPALKRPAPSNWQREALASDTCVQMDTVQGKFFVKLAKGTELAQNPKTGAWHHTKCTNLTDWKQPALKVAEAEVPAPCNDCNKTIEHTTTIIEKLVVICPDGTVKKFDGSEKKDPKAEDGEEV